MEIEKVVRWRCPICKKEYEDKVEAQTCLDKGAEVKFEVGDIVTTAYGHYGWFDGDPDWVYQRDADVFDGTPTHKFYYVVTAVDNGCSWDSHNTRYHLATKAITKQGNGYTLNYGHIAIEKVELPPQNIVDESRNLIPKTFRRGL